MLTVTVDNEDDLFELFLNYNPVPGVQTHATVFRGLSATGPWELIRAEFELLDGRAYVFDNTAPLNTDVWFRTVAQDGSELISGPNQIIAPDAGWLRDPGRPWADIEMDFCETPLPQCDIPDVLSWVGFGTFGRPTDAGLFEILNAEKPADIWARRKNLSTEINFFSSTCFIKDRVYELFTAGGPLFLQLPSVYCWRDDFIQTTSDLAEDYITRDQRKPWRRWSAPVRTVERPLGPVQGTSSANWCAVAETFATYADLTATGDTWGDVASGETVGPVPDVPGYGEGPYGDGPYGDGG